MFYLCFLEKWFYNVFSVFFQRSGSIDDLTQEQTRSGTSEEEQQKIMEYEQYFHLIKEATGVSAIQVCARLTSFIYS